MSPNDKMLPQAVIEAAQSVAGNLEIPLAKQRALNSDKKYRQNPDDFNDLMENLNSEDISRTSEYHGLSRAEKVQYLRNHPEDEAARLLDSYQNLKRLKAFK